MRKILAVFVAALLLFPASAYAVGINYGGTITSIELDGPTVLDGEFAVDQEISGQLIFDDTTGAMSLLSFSDGTRTWAYVDGGRFAETKFFSIPLAPSLDSNDFSASYSFVNPPPTFRAGKSARNGDRTRLTDRLTRLSPHVLPDRKAWRTAFEPVRETPIMIVSWSFTGLPRPIFLP